MNLRRLTSKAKEIVDRRGGTEALKQDAEELKRIAQGEGTVSQKAKAAADALKDPGARAERAPEGPAAPTPAADEPTRAEPGAARPAADEPTQAPRQPPAGGGGGDPERL